MEQSEKKTGRLFLELGLIDAELLKKAEEQQEKTGRRLTDIFVVLGVDALEMRLALATSVQLPEVGLGGREVGIDVAKLLPETWVKKHGIVPLERVDNTLTLGMVDPFNYNIIKDVRFKTGLNVRVAVISEGELPGMIERCYGSQASRVKYNLYEVIGETGGETGNPNADIFALTYDDDEGDEELPVDIEPGTPIIPLVDRIIRDAVRARATDIHIEPARSNVHLRYRIDGVLRDIRILPKFAQEPMLSRVKIMGNMDIAEKRKPQDGHIKVKVWTTIVDLRISSLPTIFGEKIVVRVLEQQRSALPLGDLGFSSPVLKALDRLLDYPQGMILMTGPTGSGKTTTLYSALSRLNDGRTNIVTVEDPVEYQVPGLNQVQINLKTGMTFASALRSILRQDPDVILVGEMRDQETTEIAFRAAQTGHLVLSTLHTNDAVSAVTRLSAMGIDPYFVASSVLGIISQRLVRHLCPKCKVPISLNEGLAKWLPPGAKKMAHQLFDSKGCRECRNTGFWGRFPITEILVPDHTIKDFILKGRSDLEIMNIALKGGMKSIFEDGMDKVLLGLTTFKEVSRVVAPPELPTTEEKKISLIRGNRGKKAG